MQAERSHRNGLGACLAQVCTDRWPARHTFLAGLGAGRPRSRRPLASGGSFLPACRGHGLAMSPPCPRPLLCVPLTFSQGHRSYWISPGLRPHLIPVTSVQSLSPRTVAWGPRAPARGSEGRPAPAAAGRPQVLCFSWMLGGSTHPCSLRPRPWAWGDRVAPALWLATFSETCHEVGCSL